MSEPDWYAEWRHEALHELMAKNEELEAKFRMGHWPRYDYDVQTRTLKFSEDGETKLVADIQLVGTTSESAGNWLWAWGNDWWPTEVVADALATKRFGEMHGISELTTPYIEDSSLVELGWQLTAVTARVTGAVGAYRPPAQKDDGRLDGHLFFVLRDMGFAE